MRHTLDLVCNTQMDIYIQVLHTYKYVVHSLRMPLTEHPGRVWTNNYESQ